MQNIKYILNEYCDNKIYYNRNLACYIKISQKWNNIVGEVLSKICCPSFFRNSVLTITIRDSAWANEIFMNRYSIFKNIKNETGIEVAELKTRIGEIDNNYQMRNNYINKNIKNEIKKEHKEWIDNVIKEANIEDNRMREMFYNILIYEDIDD